MVNKNVLKKINRKLKNKDIKELTSKESIEFLKKLLKNNKTIIQKEIKTGALITFVYDAKNKDNVYDKTPLVMVLSYTSKYMLGVNFHWMPVKKRHILVDYILQTNASRIRNKKPIKISYQELKTATKIIGLYPVIRLYIRKRMSKKGVRIPDELLLPATKLRTETFTGGKANSTTLWKKALNSKLKIKPFA